MTILQLLSGLSGILFIIGFIPYILAILRGETKPAKASWMIWATLDSITLAGMFAEGTLNGQITGAVIGAWIVVVLALLKGTPGFTTLDKFCMAGAVIGIALWQIFSNPTLGIITSLSVVLIGSFPTFVSAWHNPAQENRTAWTIFWLSCVAAVIAIPEWTLAAAAQPLVFTFVESVMMYILYFRPRPQAQLSSVTETKKVKQGSPIEKIDV